ncbi:MAG: prepilin-type N-terminal cleavage/methylation domain-containing protein [Verrucomicrobiota bacterium]|nr:prepilin-type N-terminal cleavage/methylation domain-containing protein [Verrucomicrobiota bacterium]
MKRRAFTLVELVLAMAITSLLIILLVDMAGTTSNAWQRGEAQAETHSTARGALNLLGRELQGAVIDLDLGFRVLSVPAESNSFVLKFLSRRQPQPGEPNNGGEPAVEKVCYQLAWANESLLPEIIAQYDENHPIPVLIRTVSTNLDDVFIVKKPEDADLWSREWGELSTAPIRAGERIDGNITEVAAENVMGWRVVPYYWDDAAGRIAAADPNSVPKYYDEYLTSDKAPRALQVQLAVMPSRALPRIRSGFASQWANIRQEENLFAPTQLPDTRFNDLVRQNARYFDATFHLASKTP